MGMSEATKNSIELARKHFGNELFRWEHYDRLKDKNTWMVTWETFAHHAYRNNIVHHVSVHVVETMTEGEYEECVYYEDPYVEENCWEWDEERELYVLDDYESWTQFSD